MKKDSDKQPKQAPVEVSIEVLQARIKQLEMENAYLKKLNALVQNKEKSHERQSKNYLWTKVYIFGEGTCGLYKNTT